MAISETKQQFGNTAGVAVTDARSILGMVTVLRTHEPSAKNTSLVSNV